MRVGFGVWDLSHGVRGFGLGFGIYGLGFGVEVSGI